MDTVGTGQNRAEGRRSVRGVAAHRAVCGFGSDAQDILHGVRAPYSFSTSASHGPVSQHTCSMVPDRLDSMTL